MGIDPSDEIDVDGELEIVKSLLGNITVLKEDDATVENVLKLCPIMKPYTSHVMGRSTVTPRSPGCLLNWLMVASIRGTFVRLIEFRRRWY